MRFQELTEGRNTPCIIVDIQPAYDGQYMTFDKQALGDFLKKQKGPNLMFVNADETGMTEDNVEHEIVPWWDEEILGLDENDEPDYSFWDRTRIEDKGYGYLRGWMDMGVESSIIIKTIREMYQQKVNDSRELFPDEEDYSYAMEQFLGDAWKDEMADDMISVEWTSVAQLKRYSGCYIMGGGREECLREVELLMNAFNIKYKRIEEFVY